jgi:hypothetical protein
MNREVNENLDHNYILPGAPDAPDADLLDIDPADFVDPEEFGIRQSQANP